MQKGFFESSCFVKNIDFYFCADFFLMIISYEFDVKK